MILDTDIAEARLGSGLEAGLLAQLLGSAQRAVEGFLGYRIEQATRTEYLPASQRSIGAEDGGYEMTSGGLLIQQGGGLDALYTSGRPLRSVTTLHDNPAAWETLGGSWPSSTLLSEGIGFAVDYDEPGLSWSGKIVRQGSWSGARRSVKVVYVSGLSAAELDLETGDYGLFSEAVLQTLQAAYMQAVQMRGGAGGFAGGPVASESLDGWSVSYASVASSLTGMQGDLPPSAKMLLSGYVRMGKLVEA